MKNTANDLKQTWQVLNGFAEEREKARLKYAQSGSRQDQLCYSKLSQVCNETYDELQALIKQDPAAWNKIQEKEIAKGKINDETVEVGPYVSIPDPNAWQLAGGPEKRLARYDGKIMVTASWKWIVNDRILFAAAMLGVSL